MFFSSGQGELSLIIDVQSSIVRGSLVHFRHGQKPAILYTHNISIPYKPNSGSAYLIKFALRAVDDIIGVMSANIHNDSNSEELPRNISSVHYVLSSPWVVSQAKTISTNFKEDTTISRAYVSGLIWEERAKMTTAQNDDIRIIEEKVFDVRLNGYSVASWESRHTRELGISFVVSIAGSRMIDCFIASCEPIIRHRDHIYFHSSLFLQHLGIQGVIPDISDYALVHIHGELTDVAIVHARSCSFFGSYPFGVNTVVRSVAHDTQTTEEMADSTLNLYIKGDIDDGRAKKESVAIDTMKQHWMDEFRTLLKTSPTPEAVPRKIVISARTHEDFFIAAFKAAYPQAITEVLALDNILEQVSYGTHAERLRTTGLYAIAIHSLAK